MALIDSIMHTATPNGQALLFGVHMLLAYLVMLLVMLYEAAFFITILLGLATGYFLFELLSAQYVVLHSVVFGLTFTVCAEPTLFALWIEGALSAVASGGRCEPNTTIHCVPFSYRYAPAAGPIDVGGGCCDEMAPAVVAATAVHGNGNNDGTYKV